MDISNWNETIEAILRDAKVQAMIQVHMSDVKNGNVRFRDVKRSFYILALDIIESLYDPTIDDLDLIEIYCQALNTIKDMYFGLSTKKSEGEVDAGQGEIQKTADALQQE